MPRVGSSVSEQTSGGGNFKIDEGNVEVVNAVVLNDQPSFAPVPRCGIALTVRYWDQKWAALQDREEVTEFLGYGPTLDKVGNIKFHPGLADGPDDNDPELDIGGGKDCGGEVEAQGNCLLSASGSGPDKKSKMSIFSSSLEQHGFPAANNNGYAPNYIGLKFHASRLKMPKERETDNDSDALIVGLNGQVAGGSIAAMPGQEVKPKGAGAGKAAAGKPAAGTTAKASAPAASKPAAQAAAPKPAAAAAQTSAAVGDGELDGMTLMAAYKIAETRPGMSMTLAKLGTMAMVTLPQMKDDIPTINHKSVMANLKSSDWVGQFAEALGWALEGETVTFPAAA